MIKGKLLFRYSDGYHLFFSGLQIYFFETTKFFFRAENTALLYLHIKLNHIRASAYADVLDITRYRYRIILNLQPHIFPGKIRVRQTVTKRIPDPFACRQIIAVSHKHTLFVDFLQRLRIFRDKRNVPMAEGEPDGRLEPREAREGYMYFSKRSKRAFSSGKIHRLRRLRREGSS